MCLASTIEKPYMAEYDMIVYKVFFKAIDGLYSPYQFYKFDKTNKKYKANGELKSFKCGYVGTPHPVYYYDKGGFHSFKYKDTAIKYCHNTPFLDGNDSVVVVKCIIPQGTIIVKDNNEIASEEIYLTDDITYINQMLVED